MKMSLDVLCVWLTDIFSSELYFKGNNISFYGFDWTPKLIDHAVAQNDCD
jgi:hypothetical protein